MRTAEKFMPDFQTSIKILHRKEQKKRKIETLPLLKPAPSVFSKQEDSKMPQSLKNGAINAYLKQQGRRQQRHSFLPSSKIRRKNYTVINTIDLGMETSSPHHIPHQFFCGSTARVNTALKFISFSPPSRSISPKRSNLPKASQFESPSLFLFNPNPH